MVSSTIELYSSQIYRTWPRPKQSRINEVLFGNQNNMGTRTRCSKDITAVSNGSAYSLSLFSNSNRRINIQKLRNLNTNFLSSAPVIETEARVFSSFPQFSTTSFSEAQHRAAHVGEEAAELNDATKNLKAHDPSEGNDVTFATLYSPNLSIV